jgi:eukaryotic-like serine/threonine-protein kinase
MLFFFLQDNIGVVNMNMGNNMAALQYHEQALRMRESKLGNDHADVAATKDNMGLVYRQLNRLDMALQLHNEALVIRLRMPAAPTDLSICATKTAIANVLYQQENFSSALALYTEILELQVSSR